MIKAVSATYIMLPQQPNLNIIERKFKRQILKPDPIILGVITRADARSELSGRPGCGAR